MRSIIHYVHTSIDGYIEGPNGEFDWPTMGPELSAYSHLLTDRADTFLYGRVVWEMMAGYWPHAESISDDPHDLHFAPIWRAKPKVVVSRTLQSADWGARVMRGPQEVAELKREPGGDILLTGGTSLAAALTEQGLIDEYHIVVHPVMLGGGKPVFPRGKDRLNLTFANSRPLDGRTVVLRYVPEL